MMKFLFFMLVLQFSSCDNQININFKDLFGTSSAGQGVIPTVPTPGPVKTKVVDNFNFVNNLTALDSFFSFQAGDFIGNDGRTSADQNGLLVDSSVFRKSADGLLDHVKWLSYSSTTYNASSMAVDGVSGELQAKIVMSAKQAGMSANDTAYKKIIERFGPYVQNIAEDFRFGGAAFNGLSFENFIVLDVWFTDKMIYAYYERLPFGQTADNQYGTFSYAIPIATRAGTDPLNEFVEITVAIHYDKGYARYLVNGEERFRVHELGLPLAHLPQYNIINTGGKNQLTKSRFWSFGFGTFTLMDAALPNFNLFTTANRNPLIRLDPTPYYAATANQDGSLKELKDADFAYGSRTGTTDLHLSGQGALLRVKSMLVQFVPDI